MVGTLLMTNKDETDVAVTMEEWLHASHFSSESSFNFCGYAPLHEAARQGNVRILRSLLQRGDNVELYTQCDDALTPALVAVRCGRLAALRTLLDDGNALIGATSKNGTTAMMYACERGDTDMLDFIHANSIIVDAQPNLPSLEPNVFPISARDTPIKCTSEQVNKLNSRGSNAALWATQAEGVSALEWLYAHGCEVWRANFEGNTAVTFATIWGKVDQLRWLSAHGCSLTAPNAEGETPLMLAAHRNLLHVVRYLVEEGHCPIDGRTKTQLSVMLLTAAGGALDCMRYLLDSFYDALERLKTEVNYFGTNALLLAAKHGHIPMVRFLLSSQFNGRFSLTSVTGEGFTPLILAAVNGRTAMVQWIVRSLLDSDKRSCSLVRSDATAAINATSATGFPAVVYAARHGHLQLLRWMIEHAHCDWTAVDVDGESIQHAAARKGHLHVLLYLKSHLYVDMNARSLRGSDIAMLAALEGHLPVVEWATSHCCASARLRDRFGASSLIKAASQGHLHIVQFLLQHTDADIKVRTKDGMNAFLAAAEKGHLHVASYLFNQMTIIDSITIGSKTPTEGSSKEEKSETDSESSKAPQHPPPSSLGGASPSVSPEISTRRARISLSRSLSYSEERTTTIEGEVLELARETSSVPRRRGQEEGVDEMAGEKCLQKKEVVTVRARAASDQLRERSNKESQPQSPFSPSPPSPSPFPSVRSPRFSSYPGTRHADISSRNSHDREIFVPVHKRSEFQNTRYRCPAAMIAASAGHLSVLQFLHSNGFPMDDTTPVGAWTPLMFACEAGHLHIVHWLLSLGASPYQRNALGASSLDIAKANRMDTVIKFLSSMQ